MSGLCAAMLRARLKETSMTQGLKTQRLVALFFVGLALFNFPLLALWDHEAVVMGLPLFPTALFAIWTLLIALLAWVLERGGSLTGSLGP